MIQQQHTVTGGRVTVTGLDRYEGRAVDVVVKMHRDAMSTPQLKYWWAVPVAILAEHCGYDPDDIHVAIKYKFLRTVDANGLEVVPSIKSLDTTQMSRLIDDVRRWALTDLGVDIPEPNGVPIEIYETQYN